MARRKWTPVPDLKLLVKRSRAGLGLFAGQDIPKDTCIIEYVGRVITEKEEYTSNSKYLFEVSKKKTIDGRDRSNIARYINHSCRSNGEVDIKDGRVFIFAYKKIKTGEEITYDYGEEYWEEHIKPLGCKCDKCLAKSSAGKTDTAKKPVKKVSKVAARAKTAAK